MNVKTQMCSPWTIRPHRVRFHGLHSTFKGEQRIPVRSQWSAKSGISVTDKVRLVAETEADF